MRMRHTETRTYQASLELVELTRRVTRELPPGYAFLSDQLRRAAASVTLNLAEGCGKRTERDRKRFFPIAKGSAYEAAAVLDVARAFGALQDKLYRDGMSRCESLAAMLACYR